MEGKIDQLIKDKKLSELKKIIDDLAKDSVPVNESKPALTHMSSKMGDMDSTSCATICEHAIQVLKNRQQPFIEAVSILIFLVNKNHDTGLNF